MAKRKRKPIPPPIQPLDLPTPEQLAKGGYERGFTMHVESYTQSLTHISRHDPVERWKAAGRLSPTQVAAIELCQRLWRLVGQSQRVTASYGERIPGGGDSELASVGLIDATDQMRRIMGYFTGMAKWWNVFENVCRHGEPAGIAGSRLGYGVRGGSDRAHTVVCFVADKIAEQEGL